MRYELIGSNNYLDPLSTVLTNRGIKNTKNFLKAGLDSSFENHYSKLKNISKAVECLLLHIENNGKLWFQIDPDIDGYVSSAILINYLHRVFPKISISWRNQNGKEHEIRSDTVPRGVGLVIVPDSGSSDITEHKKLKDRGMDVLIIDHHEYEEETPYAILVNNQDSSYPNKNLSGVGVVYKVLQALDDKLNLDYAKDYLDLVAIGTVGDMVSLRDTENRYYVTQGLNNLVNPLIKALFKEQEYSTKGIASPTTTSFYIAPLFNAVIRSGTRKEKDQVFKALLHGNDTELIDDTISMMKRVRQRQNREVDKALEVIKEKIEEKKLLDNKILTVEVSDLLDKNYTGLVANKLMFSNEVKRPVLLLRYDEKSDELSGSARGYSKGEIKDFKQFLDETGYFEYNRGHANAFGSCIKRDNLIEFNDYINEQYQDIDFGSSVYEVDFVFKNGKVDKTTIEKLDENYFLWGQDVHEPLIAIEGVEIEKRNIQFIGANKNHMKFTYRGNEYIKFFINEDEKDRLTRGDSTELLEFNIVGKASVNEWRGTRTPQIIIEDYEVVKIKKRELVF